MTEAAHLSCKDFPGEFTMLLQDRSTPEAFERCVSDLAGENWSAVPALIPSVSTGRLDLRLGR